MHSATESIGVFLWIGTQSLVRMSKGSDLRAKPANGRRKYPNMSRPEDPAVARQAGGDPEGTNGAEAGQHSPPRDTSTHNGEGLCSTIRTFRGGARNNRSV